MMARSNGSKKSAFPALTSIPSDATFDFVSAGANYKITSADFVDALGVSGVITAEGATGSTPVLDDQGSTKVIRSLAAGTGIALAVDADNGIEISQNFTFDATGAELVDDPNDDVLAFRSIVGGDEISVTDAEEGEINVAFSKSERNGQIYMHTASETTTIGSSSGDSGNPIIIDAGTNWVAGVTNQFAPSSGGRLTYSNSTTRLFNVSCNIFGTVAAGTSTFAFYIAKNGTIIAASKASREFVSTEKQHLNINAIVSLAEDDYIEVFVENTTDLDDWVSDEINLLVSSA